VAIYLEVINLSKIYKTEKRPSFLTVFLQTGAMAAFGVGQPLLDLVKGNPEFLTVHQCRGWDVTILAVALLALLPLVLSTVAWLVGLIHAKTGLIIQGVILGGLFALILMPLIDKISPINGWTTIALAFLGAASLALLFVRFNFLSQNLSFLALAIPLFLFIFLSSGPIRQIIFPEALPSVSPGQEITSPVVMIIFDEFPVASLMSLGHELDCDLFPNFCRLAEHSTWYRNATSISGSTLRAVPSILSGIFPQWKETPTLAYYPENIFTLLGSSHRVSALETLTSLCPDELKSVPVPGLSERLDLLFEDLFVLYQHIVVPEFWCEKLVPVSNKWGNFLDSEESGNSSGNREVRVEELENFVSSMVVGDKPNLMVAHVLLPHNPYRFFPDGTIYNWRKKVPVLPDGTWGRDKVMMAHSYRRHILQVVQTDRMLGHLLDRLEELEIFDDAAIVITADHGTSFRTGRNRRRFNVSTEDHGGNEADIMCVPLFIKLPGQDSGVIDDRFVQTIDIMPTLASALGIKTELSFDGFDLMSKNTDERTLLDFIDQGNRVERKISTAKLKDLEDVLRWKNDLFGDSGGIERLFTQGDDRGLVGKDISTLQVKDHPLLRGRILDAQELENVDLSGRFIPAEFNGTLNGHDSQELLTLALALNGNIVGMSKTYLKEPSDEVTQWQVTSSLDVFQNGVNEAELFLVQGDDLWRIPLSTPSFVGTNLGGSRVSGIQEKGLFEPHDWDGQMTRWTDGQGEWEIPLKSGERPKILTFQIVSSGKSGADVNISVNGVTLLSQLLPSGKWETRLPLDGIEPADHLSVVVESSVFVPAEQSSNSKDRRKLGLAVTTLMVK